MRPRTIFAPTVTNVPVEALEPIIESCAKADAHLTVGTFAWAPPLPYTTPYDMTGFNAPVWGEEVEKAKAEAERHCETIDEALRRAGVEGGAEPAVVERFQTDGMVADRARFADVSMIPVALRGEIRHRAVNGTLFLSPAPVVLMGERPLDLGALGRVLIGWDGGVECGDAIRAALPMLREDTDVRVVMVDPTRDTFAHGEEPGAELATWLARHGVDVTVEPTASEGQLVSEVLLRRAEDLDADLVVMGGYGHSRLRERVFGGTTRRIVDEAERPVLLAH